MLRRVTTRIPDLLFKGYIGGSVLARLLQHPNAKSFEITALVRSEAKAKKLESFGVKAVIGSYKDDHALTEKLAENAHVVFQIVRFACPLLTNGMR